MIDTINSTKGHMKGQKVGLKEHKNLLHSANLPSKNWAINWATDLLGKLLQKCLHSRIPGKKVIQIMVSENS